MQNRHISARLWFQPTWHAHQQPSKDGPTIGWLLNDTWQTGTSSNEHSEIAEKRKIAWCHIPRPCPLEECAPTVRQGSPLSGKQVMGWERACVCNNAIIRHERHTQATVSPMSPCGSSNGGRSALDQLESQLASSWTGSMWHSWLSGISVARNDKIPTHTNIRLGYYKKRRELEVWEFQASTLAKSDTIYENMRSLSRGSD